MLGPMAQHFLFAKLIILSMKEITMIDRIIKSLMKMFVPSPATLAKMASKQI